MSEFRVSEGVGPAVEAIRVLCGVKAAQFVEQAGSLSAAKEILSAQPSPKGPWVKKLRMALDIPMLYANESLTAQIVLGGADESYKFLKPRLRDLPHEVFAVIFLNQKYGVLCYRELFRGSVHEATVHPREVVREVIGEHAAAVILAHNHPSGHVSPSPDDLRLTEELKKVLGMVGCRVVDHIIVGGNGYFSFAREGLLY